MQITIEGKTIEMGKNYSGEVYRKGAMVCAIAPWDASGCPITLSLSICSDGTILKREWSWTGNANGYLHLVSWQDPKEIEVTSEMIDAVSGLFSGRITVDDIRIPVGATIQHICPVDIEKEEILLKKKIYLA